MLFGFDYIGYEEGGYEELKETVLEDFERFHQWNFNEKQILLATLDERNFHKESNDVGRICVYLNIALIYKDNGMDNQEILIKLKTLLTKEMQEKICRELGDEYENFCRDLNSLMDVDTF